MVPIKTSLDDIQKLLAYVSRQVGWVEVSKVEKALGSIDDRKIGAMVEFGLILRDGGNLKAAPRGLTFNSGDKIGAMREVLADVELYRATLEWVHYQAKSEITATEIGQYWEASHADTLGGLKGTTLKDGAVCFGRVVEGAGLGTFIVGRGGKETRVTFHLNEIERVVDGDPAPANVDQESEPAATVTANEGNSNAPRSPAATSMTTPSEVTRHQPTVSVAASPNVHVNVEIHIAADATADTVREIFRNMARYVLDKPVDDDDI